MGQPVTGGVKTPVTPIRGFAQPLLATGAKLTIPARLGRTVTFTRPPALDGAVVIAAVAPVILTRIPFTGLPFWETLSVRVTLRPTKSVFFGATLTAVQKRTGGLGTNAPCTTTEAVAVLLAVFVSCSLATVVAVFVSVPSVLAAVTSVIVTEEPTAMLPS